MVATAKAADVIKASSSFDIIVRLGFCLHS